MVCAWRTSVCSLVLLLGLCGLSPGPPGLACPNVRALRLPALLDVLGACPRGLLSPCPYLSFQQQKPKTEQKSPSVLVGVPEQPFCMIDYLFFENLLF